MDGGSGHVFREPRSERNSMPVTKIAARRFKTEVGRLVRKAAGYDPAAPVNFLELDLRDPSGRIVFPGYSRVARSVHRGELPYYGSPVKVVAFVKPSARRALSGLKASDCTRFGDVNYYPGPLVLLYANAALPPGFEDWGLERKRAALTEGLVREDVRKVGAWGVYPVTLEEVPDLAGCLPEYINPASDMQLGRLLGKICAYSLY